MHLRCSTYGLVSFTIASMQDGELPPFVQTVTFAGHTCAQASVDTASQLSVSAQQLCFPPCAVYDSSFVTLQLSNSATSAAAFQLKCREDSTAFSFAPNAGVVPAGQTFVVAARFQAQSAAEVSATAQLIINGLQDSAQRVALSGTGCATSVTTDVGPKVLCAPTCIGASSKRVLRLRNSSRLPVHCHCNVDSGSASPAFAMQPSTLQLAGDTEAAVECIFAPIAPGPTACLATWVLQPTATAQRSAQPQQLPLMLHGEGLRAALTMDPCAFDFGAACVGDAVTASVTVFNHSQGALSFALTYKVGGGQRKSVPVTSQDAHDPTNAAALPLLSASHPSATIAARSCIVVDLVLAPAARGPLEAMVICSSKAGNVNASAASSGDSCDKHEVWLLLLCSCLCVLWLCLTSTAWCVAVL